jgi:hypothetical protein
LISGRDIQNSDGEHAPLQASWHRWHARDARVRQLEAQLARDTGMPQDAEAVKQYPNDIVPCVNLGGVLLEGDEHVLGPDYAGIDFGLNQQGDVLLFEANAAMVVPQPDEGEQWDYRRPAVARILDAVRQMLIRSASDAVTTPGDETADQIPQGSIQ